MKIKTVCELTDLSDRAIRHYIEEGLITPDYSENYLGRRSFDFTQADVRMLKDIAVLRKFDFSIPEIKQVQENPWESWKVIQNLRERKSKMIHAEQEMLTALSGLEEGKAYTITELARALSAPVQSVAIPAVDEKRNWKRTIIDIVKAIVLGTITWLPLLWVVEGLFHSVRRYYFLTFDWKSVFLTLLTLIPIAVVIIFCRFQTNSGLSKGLKISFLLICLTSRLFVLDQAENIIPASKTEDFECYRAFDPVCYANYDSFFQEMFPRFDSVFSDEYTINDLVIEAKEPTDYYYYYTVNGGYVHEVIVEWKLEKHDLYIEVDRIKTLFAEDAAENPETNNRRYVTFQKGDYTCIVKYFDHRICNEEYSEVELEYLFDEENYPSECYMFAYNEKTHTVRYINFWDYGNMNTLPHYIDMEW